MSNDDYNTMTTVDLVQEFATIADQQNDALLSEDQAEVNRLFWRLMAIQDELKSRAGDQRSALMSLYESPNMQVRLKAAKATLAVAPVAARQLLQEIETSGCFPQAGEAGMSLWNLDRGVFRPT